MSCIVPQSNMARGEAVECSYQARAIIRLCESAAWAIQNGGDATELSDAIGSALGLALDLWEPMHDVLEMHEGVKGGAS